MQLNLSTLSKETQCHSLHKKGSFPLRMSWWWSHLLKKSVMENFSFCAVIIMKQIIFLILLKTTRFTLDFLIKSVKQANQFYEFCKNKQPSSATLAGSNKKCVFIHTINTAISNYTSPRITFHKLNASTSSTRKSYSYLIIK